MVDHLPFTLIDANLSTFFFGARPFFHGLTYFLLFLFCCKLVVLFVLITSLRHIHKSATGLSAVPAVCLGMNPVSRRHTADDRHEKRGMETIPEPDGNDRSLQSLSRDFAGDMRHATCDMRRGGGFPKNTKPLRSLSSSLLKSRSCRANIYTMYMHDIKGTTKPLILNVHDKRVSITSE